MAVAQLHLDDNNAFNSLARRFVVRLDPYRRTTHVLLATCAHRGGPMNLAEFDDGMLVCPWHETRTRCPRSNSRRSPFAFVRSGRRVTVVGDAVDEIYHLPVPDDDRRS